MDASHSLDIVLSHSAAANDRSNTNSNSSTSTSTSTKKIGTDEADAINLKSTFSLRAGAREKMGDWKGAVTDYTKALEVRKDKKISKEKDGLR
jgi:hypothetical protein